MRKHRVTQQITERERYTMETYTNFPNFNYSASETPCKKHPNSSPVGICAYCLKEKLVKLTCPECGENRRSSCSCSDNSTSYRDSCSKTEIGRISLLIENEKIDNNPDSQSKRKDGLSEKFIFLRRSSSSCVEIKKSNGFWKIKRLFRKKKRTDNGCVKNGEFCDDKREMWVPDIMGVSKSRSLCSFRGGGRNDLDEQSDCAFSSAKISDVTSGIFFDSDKHSRFLCESESRESGFRGALSENSIDLKDQFRNRSAFPVKESDFSAMDESAFIDLKLDSLSKFKKDFTVNESGLRRGSRSQKVWKWIF